MSSVAIRVIEGEFRAMIRQDKEIHEMDCLYKKLRISFISVRCPPLLYQRGDALPLFPQRAHNYALLWSPSLDGSLVGHMCRLLFVLITGPD